MAAKQTVKKSRVRRRKNKKTRRVARRRKR